MPITQSGDIYQYRPYLETNLTNGRNLTNSFWYLDRSDMLPCDPSTTDKTAAATNVGFITRSDKIKQSKNVQLYGRLHSDICKVTKFLFPGVNLLIKLNKARSSFYIKNSTADSKNTFKCLDAKLFVKRIRSHPDLLSAHNDTLMVLLRDIT